MRFPSMTPWRSVTANSGHSRSGWPSTAIEGDGPPDSGDRPRARSPPGHRQCGAPYRPRTTGRYRRRLAGASRSRRSRTPERNQLLIIRAFLDPTDPVLIQTEFALFFRACVVRAERFSILQGLIDRTIQCNCKKGQRCKLTRASHPT